jgi:hypothetical protein
MRSLAWFGSAFAVASTIAACAAGNVTTESNGDDAGSDASAQDAASDAHKVDAHVADAAPACDAGTMMCGTACVDTRVDPANCGTCGNACTSAQICSTSHCILSCPMGEIDCNGTCTNPLTDQNHCGATAGCGVGDAGSPGAMCALNDTCTNGTCLLQCQTGLVNCNNVCINPATDNTHCGATAGCGMGGGTAGNMCTVNQTCINGMCTTSTGRGTIFLIRDDTDTLQRIVNPDTTPSIVDVGPLGIGFAFGDCVWDSGNRTLYMVEGRTTKSLYTINTTTGAATLVGVHGITDMFALGYDPVNNVLYGNDLGDLYTMNIMTGAATVVGPSTYLNGLAWYPPTSTMYAISSGGSVYTMNLMSGAATSTTGGVLSNNNGMTYDPVINRIWVVNYDGSVAKYDPSNAWAGTTVLTTQGEHTAVCYVPN